MINIEITDGKVYERTGRSRAGKEFAYLYQQGLVELPNGERRSVQVRVESSSERHEPGTYQILAESVYVDGFGNLRFGTLKLKKLK